MDFALKDGMFLPIVVFTLFHRASMPEFCDRKFLSSLSVVYNVFVDVITVCFVIPVYFPGVCCLVIYGPSQHSGFSTAIKVLLH